MSQSSAWFLGSTFSSRIKKETHDFWLNIELLFLCSCEEYTINESWKSLEFWLNCFFEEQLDEKQLSREFHTTLKKIYGWRIQWNQFVTWVKNRLTLGGHFSDDYIKLYNECKNAFSFRLYKDDFLIFFSLISSLEMYEKLTFMVLSIELSHFSHIFCSLSFWIEKETKDQVFYIQHCALFP